MLTATIQGDRHAAVEPVVLLHPLGLDHQYWDGVAEVLALSGYQSFALDLRGHGRYLDMSGPAEPDRLSLDDHARDVAEFIERSERGRVHLCGSAMGAAVAARVAATRPELVRSVTLSNMVRLPGTASEWDARAQRVSAHGLTPLVTDGIPRWFTPEFRQTNPERVRAMVSVMENMSVPGYLAQCSVLPDIDVGEDVRRIMSPTLFLRGISDPFTPQDKLLELSSYARTSRVEAIEGAHFVAAENPEGFARILRTFLREMS